MPGGTRTPDLLLRRQPGLKADKANIDAVTLIQRLGSAANLKIHLHCLVLDGVYSRCTDSAPVFVEVPAPTDEARRCCTGSLPARSCSPVGVCWLKSKAKRSVHE